MITSGSRPPVWGLCVVGLGASLAPLDLAVNVAFPAITAAFELETQAIRWVVAAYVVCYASLMLAFGSLGDVIGYRRVFRAGLLLAVAAFVLCALAPDYRWLLAARMVQGIAAALLLSCAPALATSLFDEGRRLWVLGAYSSMAAIAGVVAPLLGGISIAAFGWAGVFWFRVPLALLALLALALLPEAAQPTDPPEPRKFDRAGVPLLAAGIALLLLAPTLIQSAQAPWPVVYAAVSAALAGAILLAAFARLQRGAARPFLPRASVRDPDFALLNLASCAVHLAGFAVPLLVPFYLARLSGYGPIQSGGVLTFWAVGMLVGSALAANAARRIGRGPTALLGGTLVAAGQVAIGLWPGAAAPAVMLPGLLLHGAGIGLFQVAYADIVIAALPQRDRGVAGSLTILTRTFGIVIGAAALSAALNLVEECNLAAGQSIPEAFLAAFQSVFRYSALAFALVFSLSWLSRRTWKDR